MKKEIRQITCPATQTIYVANDGQEFFSESACAKHERRLSFEALFDKIQMCRELDQVPPIGLNWIESEDIEFYWFYIGSQADFDLLNEACNLNLLQDWYKDKFINRWVCISMNHENEFGFNFNDFSDAAYVLKSLGLKWPTDPSERI